ncbi:unnamed protein product [Amoebophrya sp. A25]|nr:unnamed protein product [Amoebophrya sp. A25]|eukprot:GSA25T00015566001.1
MSSFPVEYQDWILLIITFTALFTFVFPFYLTGLSNAQARHLGQYLQRRLLLFYAVGTACNVTFLILVLAILPDWDLHSYLEHIGIGIEEVMSHLNVMASSGLVLFLFFIIFALKDRIKILLGIENQPLFRISFKDCCGLGGSDKAIEVYVYKVEELGAGSIMRANDLFIECALGSNETVRTRVHKGAGSGAMIKEYMQLNFDPGEEEDKLFVYCRHQDLLSSATIGTLELSTNDVKQIIEVDDIQEFRLFPQGKISMSIGYVDTAEVEAEDGGPAPSGWRKLLNTC